MLTINDLLGILEKIFKELRYKYVAEVRIDRIVEHKSKYTVLFIMDNSKIKMIIDKESGKIRVYSGITSLDLTIKRVFKREYDRVMRRKSIGEEPV
ncbi:MAG: hypothetical protein B6U89_05195 [Desulfurococcales archaeon ex4484_58]|nr:MAG: hypothetical protein B6U89_05195 [Desulfurococcales archaeon ex4484_58]